LSPSPSFSISPSPSPSLSPSSSPSRSLSPSSSPSPSPSLSPSPIRPSEISPPVSIGSGYSKSSGGVFGVIVKRQGVFRSVGTGLSKEGAVALGSAKVRGSSAASFQVTKGGQPIKINAPSGFYSKGVTLIERPKFRINTPGELSEITYEGIRTQRSRRVI
jgi:hypothetical protein